MKKNKIIYGVCALFVFTGAVFCVARMIDVIDGRGEKESSQCETEDQLENVSLSVEQGISDTSDFSDILEDYSTDFKFTSIKITDPEYDYYSYMLENGYEAVDNKEQLSNYCEEKVLSLTKGRKNVCYILSPKGTFDELSAEMGNKKDKADATGLPADIYARNEYLFSELGLDYQYYYCRGVALFMIKKIQDIENIYGEYSVYAIYYLSYESSEEQALAENIAKEVADSLSGTDTEKIAQAYTYVCNRIRYSEEIRDLYPYTSYGALINQNAVCEGYVKAFKMILDNLGVENEIVLNSDHAWNIVKCDDEWYFTDITNDDANECRAYFLLGKDVLCSKEPLVVDGYVFTSEIIDSFGYKDGSNTSQTELSGHSVFHDIKKYITNG